VEYTLHIDNGGELYEVHGSVSGVRSTSKVEKVIFRGSKAIEKPDHYAPYQEGVILEKWGRFVPSAHILKISDPASIVEVMLGAMALKQGTMDLESFVRNMKDRRVAKATREDVQEALEAFASSGVIHKVNADVFG
jgi:hypothetical protein